MTLRVNRRMALGLDYQRLSMLLAVMHRHGGIHTSGMDVYVNVVGGVKVMETGSDLAVLIACASSIKKKPLPVRLCVFGEVGLSGEIRPVPNGQERLKEAMKHGLPMPSSLEPMHLQPIIHNLKIFKSLRLMEA